MKTIMMVLACAAVTATSTVTTAPSGGNLADVLSLMERKGKEIKTLTADFTQTKRFTFLDEEQVSRGKIYYGKGGKMAWHYDPPDSNQVYLNDGVAWTYIPDIKQIQKIDLGKDYKVSSLMVGFGVPAAELEKNFTIRLLSDDQSPHYVLELVPKKEEVAQFLDKINVWLDRDKLVPVKTQQFEKSKDSTTFEFTNISLNAPLKKGFFTFTVPEGVEVVDYSDM